jgi:hypothetical protein
MIPQEAIEAAADYLPHSGDCESRPERDCTCRLPRMNLMRAALEAAAPFIRADAKREAMEDAAIELLSDESAPPKSTKEWYNAIYASWLFGRTAAVRGEG